MSWYRREDSHPRGHELARLNSPSLGSLTRLEVDGPQHFRHVLHDHRELLHALIAWLRPSSQLHLRHCPDPMMATRAQQGDSSSPSSPSQVRRKESAGSLPFPPSSPLTC
ncbi:rCG61548 [Rattus norvegicus]|uniref:RCG61548 n=1 Tax=Rattus norvegicus TaxID=10116 RepID=A6HA77_RAT|nr:rCG61548 [Rattus norvegicus]